MDDPLYLHYLDHSSLVLVSDLLNEMNYVLWSRAMEVALEARDKFGFVNGEIKVPIVNDAKYKQWMKVNSTLISWIMNALFADISRGYLFTENAENLWNELKEQFGGSNGPRVFYLRRSMYTSKQGGESVVMYYNKIKRLWDELAVLEPNVAVIFYGEERMMQFLMGLGEEYDSQKSNIAHGPLA
ncbi:hypothetical protein LIER_38514 [Lithospermum erythrorhizon]|uniref:Retrotransposon Copia-like N-terminal domain-containing protein n=1 Tax=Lithospermum erythrorhizon TaxID=34254 RepID=A0AAV3Q3J5_LITER